MSLTWKRLYTVLYYQGSKTGTFRRSVLPRPFLATSTISRPWWPSALLRKVADWAPAQLSVPSGNLRIRGRRAPQKEGPQSQSANGVERKLTVELHLELEPKSAQLTSSTVPRPPPNSVLQPKRLSTPLENDSAQEFVSVKSEPFQTLPIHQDLGNSIQSTEGDFGTIGDYQENGQYEGKGYGANGGKLLPYILCIGYKT